MSDYLRLVVIFFAAINPAAVVMAMRADGTTEDRQRRWQAPLLAAAIALALYAFAAGGAERFLDWLQIEPESFRVAAGVVMATGGVYTVWFGRWGNHSNDAGGISGAVFPLGLPLLAGPAGLIAAISYGVDDGAGKTIGAVSVAVVLAAGLLIARTNKAETMLDALARITGALLVVIAAGLIVSGVRDI